MGTTWRTAVAPTAAKSRPPPDDENTSADPKWSFPLAVLAIRPADDEAFILACFEAGCIQDGYVAAVIDAAPGGGYPVHPDLPEVAFGYGYLAPAVLFRSRVVEAAILLLLLALPAHGWDRPGWADADHDGKDTREEIIEARCKHVVWQGQHIQQATCADIYSGAELSTNAAPQVLQLDHLFPAHVAWERGVWRLDDSSPCADPRACPSYLAFFNDWSNLNLTRARTNGQKSDLMPGKWCPEANRPAVARQFREVVAAYHLPLLPAEEAGLRSWERGVCR